MTLAASNASTINASWSSVLRATSYNIQYSTNSDFSGAVNASTAATSKSIGGLLPYTRYYFRINASGPAVTSIWRPTTSQITLRQADIKIATYNIWTSNKDFHQVTVDHPERKWSNRKWIAQKTVKNAEWTLLASRKSS